MEFAANEHSCVRVFQQACSEDPEFHPKVENGCEPTIDRECMDGKLAAATMVSRFLRNEAASQASGSAFRCVCTSATPTARTLTCASLKPLTSPLAPVPWSSSMTVSVSCTARRTFRECEARQWFRRRGGSHLGEPAARRHPAACPPAGRFGWRLRQAEDF